EEAYPLDEQEEEAKTHIVMGWLLGSASDLEHALEMSLISGILLNHAASPLRHALESTELATSASPLCGLADGARELVFMAGVEGSEPSHADAIETLILDVLSQVVKEGVDPEEAESVLHQIELNEREIGGDRYPYGLSLLMNLLSPALQDADPLPLLDINPQLERLRESIQDRFYIAGLVHRWLLDNQHRVRLSLRPDRGMSARARDQEDNDLLKISAQLNEQQLTDLASKMEALTERQSQLDDEDALPRVSREDIPPALPEEPAVQTKSFSSGLSLGLGYAGTNGLVYQRIVMDMPVLDATLLPWLPFYKSVVTELGAGQEGYMSRQRRLAACTGGLALSEVAYTSPEDQRQAGAYLMLMGKSLTRHQHALSELMLEQLVSLRLDEPERIRELFQQMRLRWDHSVTHDGHQLAMGRAAASMSTLAAWRASQRGLLGLRFVREQDRKLAQDDRVLEGIIQALQAIHQAVLSQGRQIFWVGESGQEDVFLHALGSWPQPSRPGLVTLPEMAIETADSEAWLTQTQVQFCAQSYPAVPPGHPDAAALRLLGPLLRNLYLHGALRERGGAYGGGATYVADDAAFHLHSYRDPRFEGTLDDFQLAIDGIIHQAPTDVQLEEALLAVIASMDKPSSPAGSVLQVLTGALTGRDRAFRSQMRNDLLQVTVADVQRVAKTYLQSDLAKRVVIMPADLEQRARDRGFKIETLL
ncbi:MAG: peptidase M16, partial [Pseudomonadales bacterium]|nr:peptidase M16 [Pseudomonadales bacterium]